MYLLPQKHNKAELRGNVLRDLLRWVPGKVLAVLGVSGLLCSQLWGQPEPQRVPTFSIPFLSTPPVLENFLTMKPEGEVDRRMVKITGFVQRDPHDGQPASQRTEAYLGYDHKNLYVVFVCYDDPAKVRARRARREDVYDDDNVEIMLDTFHDQRRAYAFQTNPLGVQWDAIWTEVAQDDSGNHFDTTFDTLWYSHGRLTDRGYVVWMAIPFRSLRFSLASDQEWGVILYRGIIRENENDFWPPMSSKVEGRLGRAASANGLESISPGRNMQFIPYGLFNSFRTLNTSDPGHPHFDSRAAGGKIGLDSKFILRDSLVLDVTGNPDFSQVESDDPQVTVNQRFEVFFPEKRPFFIENADYFRTPIDLLFTRRIEDPTLGTRLSGRAGHYGLGFLFSDDKSPGEIVVPSDPLFRKKAYFAIARVNRDLANQSTVGLIYTDREMAGAFNRVGGADTRLKFSRNWTSTFQAVVSSTRNTNGTYQAGPAYKADVGRSGLHLSYGGTYNDYSPGFITEPGFVNRVDVREILQTLSYRFRPRHNFLIAWGPMVQTDQIWDHNGLRLDTFYQANFELDFKRQTTLSFAPYVPYRQRLRPSDFPTLIQNQDYNQHFSYLSFSTSYFPQVNFHANYNWGDQINYVPPARTPPVLDFGDYASAGVIVRPVRGLKIENTYLFSRLKDRATGMAVFNNHILRSKWNWQFNNELSFRVIMQYATTLANPSFTTLQTRKQLSPQFLITYLVHPGTALYVGYNSDLQNIDPSLALDPNRNLRRTRNRLINDGREFFVKASYLLRF